MIEGRKSGEVPNKITKNKVTTRLATHDGTLPVKTSPVEITETSPEALPVYNPMQAFLERAIDEAKGLSSPKIGKGPYYEGFNTILSDTTKKLHAIDPTLTPEFLKSPSYVSHENLEQRWAIAPEKSSRLGELNAERLRKLYTFVESHYDTMATQTIPNGLLEAPAYQQMEVKNSNTCFNACFRMILGDITNKPISESTVSRAVINSYKQDLVEDDDYLKIFKTTAIQEKSGKLVSVLSYIGADISTIAKTAAVIKEKKPEAKVYCILNLGSEKADDPYVWHTTILLGASEDTVTVHDPSEIYGAPNKVLNKGPFAVRWARTYNRAHLIVARPLPMQ